MSKSLEGRSSRPCNHFNQLIIFILRDEFERRRVKRLGHLSRAAERVLFTIVDSLSNGQKLETLGYGVGCFVGNGQTLYWLLVDLRWHSDDRRNKQVIPPPVASTSGVALAPRPCLATCLQQHGKARPVGTLFHLGPIRRTWPSPRSIYSSKCQSMSSFLQSRHYQPRR